jgi:hypothetical protein
VSAAVDSTPANPGRGEAALKIGGVDFTLRPTFGALVAAEAEIGPLFALVDRAAEGKLTLAELAVLFWHCLVDRPPHLTREGLGEAVAMAGLSAVAPVLRRLLGQILAGR